MSRVGEWITRDVEKIPVAVSWDPSTTVDVPVIERAGVWVVHRSIGCCTRVVVTHAPSSVGVIATEHLGLAINTIHRLAHAAPYFASDVPIGLEGQAQIRDLLKEARHRNIHDMLRRVVTDAWGGP